MNFDKCDWRDNEEELKNGVYVWRYTKFTHPEDSEMPWAANINIGGWHYSQSGVTKEDAINKLYSYMHNCRLDFENYIKLIQTRIEVLDEFLHSLPS